MTAEPRCVLDRSRPCGQCVAPSPRECPYPYLTRDDGPDPEPAPTDS